MKRKYFFIVIAIGLCIVISKMAMGNTDAKKYFQQSVDYTIDVTLIDSTNILKAFVKIDYTNNSEDTLQVVYIHLWPNAFKNDRSKFNQQLVRNRKTSFYFSNDKGKGYIKDLAFTVNNKRASMSEVNGQSDVVVIDLPTALLPHQTIKIETPFTVKIPKCISRLGHGGKQDYQITQWYPKLAVYDMDGWHPMAYLDQGEFYGDYGKYTVNIKVPENYVVAATGVLQNLSEIQWIQNQCLQKDSLTISELNVLKNRKLVSSEIYKTISFVQDSIHDFAWFADKRFLIEKSSVLIQDKKVESYIYYLPNHYNVWHGSCNVINKTIEQLSKQVGNYPYAQASAVDGCLIGGGGMEFPMIAVIAKMYSKYYFIDVLIHEIGHNWFQGILGTNERDYAFMDEGLNTFYENKVSNFLLKTENKETDNLKSIDYYLPPSLTYQAVMGKNQPITTSSDLLSEINYGNNVYYKTAIYFCQLQQYLGDSLFNSCIKNYYATWHHRHPKPSDLQAVFENTTNQNLDWFFVDLLSTIKNMDFKIGKVAKINNQYIATIINKTGTIAPVSVDVFLKDSIIYSNILSPFAFSSSINLPVANFDKIIVDGQNKMFDVNRKNNTYFKNRLFKKHQFHWNIKENATLTDKHEFFALPTVGYNYYNGLLLGAIFHNMSTYQSKFRFYAMPQYGLYSNTLEGMAAIGYSLYLHKKINRIELFMHSSKYAFNTSKQNIDTRIFNHFIRLVPQINIVFRNKQANNFISNKLNYKHFLIWQNQFIYSDANNQNIFKPKVSDNSFSYISKLQFVHANDRILNPYSYQVTAEGNSLFAKISAEGKITASYNLPNKSLQIRVFAGKFFNFASNPYDAYNYRLAGTHTSANDYTFSNYYIGRSAFNNDALVQQISDQEGGMKLTSSFLSSKIGLSDNYLLAINVKSDLPINLKLPIVIRPFVDFIAYKNASIYNSASLLNAFDAGIQLSAWKDRLAINIPLFMSSDYADYFKSTFAKKDRWKHQITFSILINKADLYNNWAF